MRTFTYRSGQLPNEGAFTKTGLDRSSFAIDFKDGLGTATLGVCSIGCVNQNNVDVQNLLYSGITSTGSVATIALKTGSTGGTVAATDGDRFRVRTQATLSDSRVLIYDTFLYVNNPAYNPD